MQSLASEVVALEEKLLQLRSREIRLQKEVERLQEDLQDRSNLLATIDLLQVWPVTPRLALKW